MTTTQTWLLWQDTARLAADNMAIDELLLEAMRESDALPILRFYDWADDAYSIGYFQPYESAPQGNHTIVRRPSGGGVVDHRNDITFTLVFPAQTPLFECDRFESYRLINAAVMSAFRSLGIECDLFAGDIPKDHDRSFLVCFQQPAKFDVISPAGKLCGGAQRRKLYGMLHQGSILCDHLESQSPKAIVEAITQAFTTSFSVTFKPYIPDTGLLESAAKLAETRYSHERWNKKK